MNDSLIPTVILKAVPLKKASTIREMLHTRQIFVPSYQRAYSWETPAENRNRQTHTNVFLSDLVENTTYVRSGPYYFGHFLFQEAGKGKYAIIDGQQRLTTIVMFFAALYRSLEKFRPRTEEENLGYRQVLKDGHSYRFLTVNYDKAFFNDYVVDNLKGAIALREYHSAVRIQEAFDFFMKELGRIDEPGLVALLNTLLEARCSTYIVNSESEAIQMFIFQNDRGKKPTALEILKADFMFAIHLGGGIHAPELIKDIQQRFQGIYKAVSVIGNKISEDEVLSATYRVFFNNLMEDSGHEKVRARLKGGEPLVFIKEFTRCLEVSFAHLGTFFGADERAFHNIHSLVSLGNIGIVIPFVIKAYSFNVPMQQRLILFKALESMVLRHRLVGTRADLSSRLKFQYHDFKIDSPDIQPILDRINMMKSTMDWWWGHWSDSILQNAIKGWIHARHVRFLLWKYENHLRSDMPGGYVFFPYNGIIDPEVEHIAPQTPTSGHDDTGYCDYDDDFKDNYLNCLGNYLLISKTHNCVLSNSRFVNKYDKYVVLKQQEEVRNMARDVRWTKELIRERKERISSFIMTTI